MKAKLQEAIEAGQEDRFNAIFGKDEASLAEAERLKELSGQTAVHAACHNGDGPALRVLRAGKGDVHGDLSMADDAGNNCFHLLTQAGHETLMMSLLVDEKMIFVDPHPQHANNMRRNDLFLIAKNKKLMTPLMLAAGKGLDKIVDLLSKGKDGKDLVNVHSSPKDWLTMGPTALFYAAANGKLSTVKILLKNGATSNLKDDNGETALTSACKNGHEKVATVLLEHLSSSAVKSKTEVTFASQTLVWAVKNSMEKVALALIENGADIFIRDESSESLDLLLIVAVNAKNNKVISALMDKGADPNRRNNEKKKLSWGQWFQKIINHATFGLFDVGIEIYYSLIGATYYNSSDSDPNSYIKYVAPVIGVIVMLLFSRCCFRSAMLFLWDYGFLPPPLRCCVPARKDGKRERKRRKDD